MYQGDSIVLTGSYARGTQTEVSDIDFIVISENVSYFHTETIWNGGDELQIILLPKMKIHKMIMEQSFDNNSVLVSMLKSCIVVSDPDGFANKLSNYVDNNFLPPSEHVVLGHVSVLANRCNDLRNAKDELEIALFVSTIMILLSHLLSYNFIAGTKHSMRILCKSHMKNEMLSAYRKYVDEGDYSKILELSEMTINKFRQENLTTGLSLNNLKDNDPVVVFYPKMCISNNGMLKIISDMTSLFDDCYCYTFYQGRWQALNEGLYMYIKGKDCTSSEICKRIRAYDITIAKSRVSLGIEVAYPYYTSFSTGVFIGGKRIRDMLDPFFSLLWKEYLIRTYLHKKFVVDSYSIASGILALYRIVELYHIKTNDRFGLFKIMIEILLPDVTDPNGLYNVEQTKYIRMNIIEKFNEQYIVSSKQFIDSLNSIKSNDVAELTDMNIIMNSFVDIVGTVGLDDLEYPSIYPFNDTLGVFYSEICFIVMSIFQLSQEQKFGLIFNLSAYYGLCLDDFLLQDR